MAPIAYLVLLQHKSLPMRTCDRGEIKQISALSFAGLVEASFRLSACADGRYSAADDATVACITDEGHRAIADHLTAPGFGPRSGRKVDPPLEYLKSIQHSAFPLRTEVVPHIHCVSILNAASLVDATINRSSGPDEPHANQAVVLRITVLGREMLGKV